MTNQSIDVYKRQVEDSVKLGADILNLSLGGTAGFYSDADYLQKALAYAEENLSLIHISGKRHIIINYLYNKERSRWIA